MVVRNHFYPSSVASLQDSMDRASSRTVSATKIGELIDKHGPDNWAEPLVTELGPYAQLQLDDLVNMLEVLSKYVSNVPFIAFAICSC